MATSSVKSFGKDLTRDRGPNETPEVMTFLQVQWSFLVPLIGGREHIITQLAIYKWYTSGIYCHLEDYISPTTY